VLHDVAGGAAENHLPQPVPGEGSLDQEIAAFRRSGSEDRFTGAAARLRISRLGRQSGQC